MNIKTVLIMMLGFALLVSSVSAIGNGAMSGQHYNLNLIGVKGDNHLQNDANNGNRIFVSLDGRNKIYLTQNFDNIFNVIDADATDGRAEFTLPAPGKYQIFVRALGKPGGDGVITTCGTDPLTLEEICSISSVDLTRTKGSQKFKDVTTELTTISYDGKTVDIFDAMYEDYFWQYDNNGLKNVQLRFYPI